MLRLITLFLIVFTLCGGQVQAKPTVDGVRIGVHTDKTRMVFDISHEVPFNVFLLSNPYRVVIDLPDLAWRLPPGRGTQKAGVILGYRYGLFEHNTFRVVVDLAGPADVAKAFILPANATTGPRLVVDLVPTDKTTFLARSKTTLKRMTPRPPHPAPVPVMTKKGKPVVVIDAGHGGVDPGAISYHGVYEKIITLKAAKELKKALERSGKYKVVVTRNRDIFLRLRSRVNVTRQHKADLFISLHADSNPNAKVRGASVYTLSENASDAEAARLARQENKADLIAGVDLSHEAPDVTNILLDLAQRETMNLSAKFAKILVKELGKKTKLLRKTHRFAGFVVLKAPDVPSVLVELGYISNSKDEAMLKNASKRKELMGSIARAINAYFIWHEQLQKS